MNSAFEGPMVVYGDRPPPAYAGSNNPQLSPSAVRGGWGMIDPRAGYNQNRKGFLATGLPYMRVGSYVPAVAAVANIAIGAHVTNGTAMTLVSASGSGIVYNAAAISPYIIPQNSIPAGSLGIDANPALINFGIADPAGRYSNNFWDGATIIGRAVSITGVSGGTGGAFLVTGSDWGGYTQTATVTVAAGANTVNSTKTFKFIYSVVPQFTDNSHNYSVGTADIFGFPFFTGFFHDTLVWWNEALITANTGFTAGDTTNPATAATGDPKGTYAVQSASDGTKRLTFAQCVGISGSVTTFGNPSLFGILPA